MGTACYVKGAPRLAQMMEEELGVKIGETTADGKFTLVQ
jgi:NADH:ubiquinone oxidoreductase subunit E